MRLKSTSIVLGASMMLFGAAQALFATPIDLFNISQPTHAVVDSHTNVYPCCGADNSNTYSTGYIYNIFGASNPGVEGTGDMLFEDGHASDVVEFHTTLPVNLTSVALSVGGEDTFSGGGRGIVDYTFQQYSNASYTTTVGPAYTFTNPDNATSPSGSALTIPTSITNGQYFEVTMTTTSVYNNGGVRVISLEGFAPEPASLGLVCFGGLGLLARRRRA